MENKFACSALLILVFLAPEMILGEPRAEVVQLRCGTVLEHNTSAFSTNFISTMGAISDQMQATGFGSAQVGTGPDRNYGLAQCYGDLTLPDCVLCWSAIHARLPECFPYNSGRIYLDGCFMRLQNYSFYDEFTGPDDRTVCGNTTKDMNFQKSARRALLDAVEEAPTNGGFARTKAVVSKSKNDSVYVLANCWRTVDANSCRACLTNASASIMRCLPSSEGRAMNTGCFMRYSDKDFLNGEVGNAGGSKGTIIIYT